MDLVRVIPLPSPTLASGVKVRNPSYYVWLDLHLPTCSGRLEKCRLWCYGCSSRCVNYPDGKFDFLFQPSVIQRLHHLYTTIYCYCKAANNSYNCIRVIQCPQVGGKGRSRLTQITRFIHVRIQLPLSH